MRKRALGSLFVLGALLTTGSAKAEKLYAASGGNGKVSTLYTIDAATGKIVEQIGAEGGVGVVLTSLARNPLTGVMYGTTSSGGGPNGPDGGSTLDHLVTIDLKTGAATLIAPLKVAGPDGGPGGSTATTPDISFDANGNLFAWTESGDYLARIDVKTGAVTRMTSVYVNSWGSGLTAGPGPLLVGTQSGSKGKLHFFDPYVDGGASRHTAQLNYADGSVDDLGSNAIWALAAHKKTGRVYGLENSQNTVVQDASTPDGGTESVYRVHFFELVPSYEGPPDATTSVDAGGVDVKVPVSVELKRFGLASWPNGRLVQLAALAWSYDEDDDGVVDAKDVCVAAANPDQLDTDGDGRGDVCDACPTFANPGDAPCPTPPATTKDAGTSQPISGGSSAGGTAGADADAGGGAEEKKGGCAVGSVGTEDTGALLCGPALVGLLLAARRRRRS